MLENKEIPYTDLTGIFHANQGITQSSLSPGLNSPGHYITGSGASTSWPFDIATIYDSNWVDQYFCMNASLTGGTRGTPTFTSGNAKGGFCFRLEGSTPNLQIANIPSGTGVSPSIWITFRPSGLLNLGYIPTYANDAAAGAAGLVQGDLWKDASGNVHSKL